MVYHESSAVNWPAAPSSRKWYFHIVLLLARVFSIDSTLWSVSSVQIKQCSAVHGRSIWEKHITDLNKTMGNTRETFEEEIEYKTLCKNSSHAWVYRDALYASKEYLSPHLGHLIFLYDSTGKYLRLDFRSKNAKRIERLVMACETCSFNEVFDHSN